MLRSALFMIMDYVPRLIQGSSSTLLQTSLLTHSIQRTSRLLECKTSLTMFVLEASSFLSRPLISGQTELLDQYSDDAIVQDAPAEVTSQLGFAQASFAWYNKPQTDGMRSPSRQSFRLRVEDEVVFRKGCINLIVGPTGCGKSSLLLALLGEMHHVPLGPGSWVNLPREGGVAYW
jgi:ABC-type multidrug transport system fused ATPase/permease subunit